MMLVRDRHKGRDCYQWAMAFASGLVVWKQLYDGGTSGQGIGISTASTALQATTWDRSAVSAFGRHQGVSYPQALGNKGLGTGTASDQQVQPTPMQVGTTGARPVPPTSCGENRCVDTDGPGRGEDRPGGPAAADAPPEPPPARRRLPGGEGAEPADVPARRLPDQGGHQAGVGPHAPGADPTRAVAVV